MQRGAVFFCLLTNAWLCSQALANAQSNESGTASTQPEVGAKSSAADVQPGAPQPLAETPEGAPLPAPESSLEPQETTSAAAQSSDVDDLSLAELEPEHHGVLPVPVRLGIRAGYALPFGSVRDGQPLSETARSAIPITIEGMLSLRHGIDIGVYLQIAAGQGGDQFNQGCVDCSLIGGRLGLMVDKHFNAGAAVDPWFGLNLGYEWLSVSREFDDPERTFPARVKSTATFTALPELALQAGIELGSRDVRVGPYVAIALARYADIEYKVTCAGCVDDASRATAAVKDRAFHGWLTVGLRGAYVL